MSDKFYHSRQWQKVSQAYMKSKNYVCERCGGVGVICHHRKHLTPATVSDINMSLNFDNLECLCKTCHNKEHFGDSNPDRECVFNGNGDVVCVREYPPVSDRTRGLPEDRRGPRNPPLC